jgi:hypothetical protein
MVAGAGGQGGCAPQSVHTVQKLPQRRQHGMEVSLYVLNMRT